MSFNLAFLLSAVLTALLSLTSFLALFLAAKPEAAFTALSNGSFIFFGLTAIFAVISFIRGSDFS